ncbi:hypothetical protein EJF36_05180 [Bacillus sp. HMF5848]|uniref:YheC/YheD family protein n=1 Tax=Bacillus sp. HMF5848 TaxID=2495421 RepID=UPI000F78862B|nr:YheC/YheD family protein [Bacillus sp. HMF5848]RSK26300.1 hypothetical protein EJF36_05180 [Bacillus sp. HMF5848]
MKVYYDLTRCEWYQTEVSDIQLYLGHSRIPVPYRSQSSSPSLSWNVMVHENRLGPVIAIVAAPYKQNSFSGNGAFFKKIMNQFNGIVIVMTDLSLRGNTIKSFVYWFDAQAWVHVEAPWPDVMYNRIPRLKQIELPDKYPIPVFNRTFFKKYEVYKRLYAFPRLRDYLPETRLLNDMTAKDILSFMQQHKRVYIKANDGSQGKGTLVVKLLESGHVQMRTVKGENKVLVMEDFKNVVLPLLKKQQEWVVQQAIEPDRIDDLRYDLRILAHLTDDASHSITGIGIRAAPIDAVVTHVPNGGQLLNFEKVKTRINTRELDNIIATCGEALSYQYGLIGEFSVDMTLSNTNNICIFEANARPMKFDERDIEKKRLKNLQRVCYQLAEFPPPNEAN